MREVITSETCRSCGACCWSSVDQPRYADVTAEDVERLPKRFVRLHVIQSRPFDRLAAALDGQHVPDGAIATKWETQRSGPFKGIDVCVCVALRGSLMHRVSCSVYEKRPRVCRDAVKPGDKACRAYRALFLEAIDRVKGADEREKTAEPAPEAPRPRRRRRRSLRAPRSAYPGLRP